MKRFFIISLLFAATATVFMSCSSTPESKLIGTWKAQKVETDFDANRTTPDMISQVVEMQKQMYFRMINDSIMTIISKNDTHEAHWKYNTETKSVTYFFNGMNGIPSVLGTFNDGTIISESKTPLGKITIYYEKE